MAARCSWARRARGRRRTVAIRRRSRKSRQDSSSKGRIPDFEGRTTEFQGSASRGALELFLFAQGEAFVKTLAFAAALLIAVAASAQPSKVKFSVPVEYFTLPNGLKVVVSEEHS